MAHIDLQNDLPGIRGLMLYSPATGQALNDLAQVLLHDEDNTLSRGERELIAGYVSSLNDCFFCHNVHAAMAQHYLQKDTRFIDEVSSDYRNASLSAKMKALLAIAAQVQVGGKAVTTEAIAEARAEGATDREIHDAVLIAAAFCMFNRYVDGLQTWAPQDRQVYIDRAKMRAEDGYSNINLNK